MLKKVRQLFGYTQEELAAKMTPPMKQNYYALIESDPNRSAPAVEKIGEFLGISVDFLLRKKSYPFTRNFYIFTLRDEPRYAYPDIFSYLLQQSTYLDVIFFEAGTDFFWKKPFPVCIAVKDDRGTIILINRRAKRRTLSVAGQPKSKTVETENLVSLNLFRQLLYEKEYVYEKTLAMEDSLYKKIKKAVDRIVTAEGTTAATERVTDESNPDIEPISGDIRATIAQGVSSDAELSEETNQQIEPVSREDIDKFFPNLEFFQELYERHRK